MYTTQCYFIADRTNIIKYILTSLLLQLLLGHQGPLPEVLLMLAKLDLSQQPSSPIYLVKIFYILNVYHLENLGDISISKNDFQYCVGSILLEQVATLSLDVHELKQNGYPNQVTS